MAVAVHPHYVRTCDYYTAFWALRQPKAKRPYAQTVFFLPLDECGSKCYNMLLREHNMSEAQAALYAKLAQLQALTDLDDDAIQDAISQLAQAIEDVVK